MVATASLNIKRVKRTIAQCPSIEGLKEIILAAQERVIELRKQEAERAHQLAWDAISKAKEGYFAVVFRGAEITLAVAENGARATQNKVSRFLPGMLLHVHSVRLRAKRLWLRNDAGDRLYGMDARDLGALNIRVFPDELTAHVAMAEHGQSAAAQAHPEDAA